MGIRMLLKIANKSKYLEIIKGKHIHIKRNEAGPIHLDGEPQIIASDVKINIVPASLKVIVGDAYKAI